MKIYTNQSEYESLVNQASGKSTGKLYTLLTPIIETEPYYLINLCNFKIENNIDIIYIQLNRLYNANKVIKKILSTLNSKSSACFKTESRLEHMYDLLVVTENDSIYRFKVIFYTEILHYSNISETVTCQKQMNRYIDKNQYLEIINPIQYKCEEGMSYELGMALEECKLVKVWQLNIQDNQFIICIKISNLADSDAVIQKVFNTISYDNNVYSKTESLSKWCYDILTTNESNTLACRFQFTFYQTLIRGSFPSNDTHQVNGQ